MAVERVESRLGWLYRRTYELLCGKHPYVWPWHFQWLDTLYLRWRLRVLLPTLSGRILDVGCGEKPYRRLFALASDYVGMDVAAGAADIVVAPQSDWPVQDASFDIIFSTQVIEHVECLPHVLSEMARVCKPGGRIVLSFPFLYNEHGSPFDYQRFTVHGARSLLSYEVSSLERQGGIGSTLTILLLNWINESLNTNKLTRLMKALLLPFWVPFCLLANLVAFSIDRIDRTEKFYNNVFVIFAKGKVQASSHA